MSARSLLEAGLENAEEAPGYYAGNGPDEMDQMIENIRAAELELARMTGEFRVDVRSHGPDETIGFSSGDVDHRFPKDVVVTTERRPTVLLRTMKIPASKLQPEDNRIPLKLSKPPASRLTVILQTVFSRKSMELVFAPMIADFRDEYAEALLEHAPRVKRFFIYVRHYGAILHATLPKTIKAIVACLLGKALERHEPDQRPSTKN